MKYTKAPWKARRVMTDISIGGAPHRVYPITTEWKDKDGQYVGIAICILPNEDITNELIEELADTQKLIAAAPELLETLKEMVNEFETFSDIPKNYKTLNGWDGGENPRTLVIIKAMKLIEKATGKKEASNG